jgi:hypothetical protein
VDASRVAAGDDGTAAGRIAGILRCFRSVTDFHILRNPDDARIPSEATVDKFLRGMAQSESPVRSLFLLTGGGAEAIREFIERFPDLSELLIGGMRPCSCSVEFTRSVASCLVSVPPTKLRRLNLFVRGSGEGVAEIIRCCAPPPCFDGAARFPFPELRILAVGLDDETVNPPALLRDVAAACSACSRWSLCVALGGGVGGSNSSDSSSHGGGGGGEATGLLGGVGIGGRRPRRARL